MQTNGPTHSLFSTMEWNAPFNDARYTVLCHRLGWDLLKDTISYGIHLDYMIPNYMHYFIRNISLSLAQ